MDTTENYRQLLHAIVLQGCKDYCDPAFKRKRESKADILENIRLLSPTVARELELHEPEIRERLKKEKSI